MNKKIRIKPLLIGLLTIYSPNIFAAECNGQTPLNEACFFTNVEGFDSGNLKHIGFDAIDERDGVSCAFFNSMTIFL